MTGRASPQSEAIATLGGVMTDLEQVAGRLRAHRGPAEPIAQLLDRLACEITEAAAMLRAEDPARPESPRAFSPRIPLGDANRRKWPAEHG